MTKRIKCEGCTGCSVCANVCPKKAIKMEKNSEGFLYPKIDESKCINCGVCGKKCPVINSKQNEAMNECYMGYALNSSIQYNSSSGGIFTIIANYVIDNGGIVIGAAFDDKNKLSHIPVTKKDDLHKLRGAKYLQSDMGNILEYIKENIKEKKILFVGTPCQVAGVKSFVKEKKENLICIDLICHGVPTPKLFEKYVKELEQKNGEKMSNYNFRDKTTGWEKYSNTIILGKKNKSQLHSKNDYMNLFLSDIALRESCYNCNFKLGNKYSDITLGDFWGIKKFYPEMYDKKGVSAIIFNTKNGQEIFDGIKNEIKYKKCNIEEIIEGNKSLITSGKICKKRDDFFYDLDNLNVRKLAKKYGIKEENLFKRIIKKVKKLFGVNKS